MFLEQEYCSESSTDVPWTLDDTSMADPAMFSVGNAPLWSGGAWASQDRYPDNNRLREVQNTNPGIQSANAWTQACVASPSAAAGTAQLVCSSDADCVALGGTSAKLQCLNGVCILDRQSTGTCYSHRDCLSSNKMCSGNGQCVTSIMQVAALCWRGLVDIAVPFWQAENGLDFAVDLEMSRKADIAVPFSQVENDLDFAVDFELYAETCSATDDSLNPTIQYDMYGASVWETIPDVLEMYGMCSYEDWYEYLEFIDPTQDTRANLGLCGGQAEARGCLPMASEATVSRYSSSLPLCAMDYALHCLPTHCRCFLAKVVGPPPPARGSFHAEPLGYAKVPRQVAPLRPRLPAPAQHAGVCPILFAEPAAARASGICGHEDLPAHRDCQRRQRQVHSSPDHRPEPVHRSGTWQAQLQHVHHIPLQEHWIHVGAEAVLHGCLGSRAHRLQELQEHRPVLHRPLHLQRQAVQAQGLQPSQEADAGLAWLGWRELRHVWHPAGRPAGFCSHVSRARPCHKVPCFFACWQFWDAGLTIRDNLAGTAATWTQR